MSLRQISASNFRFKFRAVPRMIPLKPNTRYQFYVNKPPSKSKPFYSSASSVVSTISENYKQTSEKTLLGEQVEVYSNNESNIVRRINKLISNDDMKCYAEEPAKSESDVFMCKECASSRRSLEENQKTVLRLIKRLNTNIERNELRLYDLEIRDIVKNEWRQLAIIIDRLMLLIFIVTTSFVLLSIFYQRPEQ
jgi:hypothetical protein